MLQVFFNEVNIALNKPAIATDQLGGATPSVMADGSNSTYFHSLTATAGTWARLDLQVRLAPWHKCAYSALYNPAHTPLYTWHLYMASVCAAFGT